MYWSKIHFYKINFRAGLRDRLVEFQFLPLIANPVYNNMLDEINNSINLVIHDLKFFLKIEKNNNESSLIVL